MISSEVVDTTFFNRFHKDLLSSENKKPEDFSKLAKAAGLKSSNNLDNILHKLRQERENLQEWKENKLKSYTAQSSFQSDSVRSVTSSYDNLKNEVEMLKSQLKSYQEVNPATDYIHKDVLNRVKKELEDKNRNFADLMLDRNQLLDELERVKWANSDIQEKRNEAEAQVNKLEQAFNEIDNALSIQRQEYDRQKQLVKSLESQLEEFYKRYATLEHQFLELKEQKSTLMAGLEEKQAQLDFSLSQIKAYELQIDELSENKDQLSAEVKELIESQKVMESNVDSLKKKKNEADVEILRLTATIQQKSVELQQQENKINQLNKEIESSNVRLSSLQLNLGQFTAENTELRETIAKLKPSVDMLTSSAQVDDEAMKALIEKLTMNIPDLKTVEKTPHSNPHGEVITTITAYTDYIQNSLKEKEKELVKSAQKLKEIEGFKTSIADLQAKLKNKEDQMKQMDQEMKALNDKNKFLDEQLANESRLKKQAVLGRIAAENLAYRRVDGIGWRPVDVESKCVKLLKQGFPIFKYLQHGGVFRNKAKVHARFIKLSSDNKELMMWNESPTIAKPRKVIFINSIISVNYGKASRTSYRHEHQAEVQPLLWRCVTIVTNERFYDFLCMNEPTTEALIVGTGMQLESEIPCIRTRNEVIFRRVIMKLKEYCKKRKITMTQMLLEGIQRYIMTTPMYLRKYNQAKSLNKNRSLERKPSNNKIPSKNEQSPSVKSTENKVIPNISINTKKITPLIPLIKTNKIEMTKDIKSKVQIEKKSPAKASDINSSNNFQPLIKQKPSLLKMYSKKETVPNSSQNAELEKTALKKSLFPAKERNNLFF